MFPTQVARQPCCAPRAARRGAGSEEARARVQRDEGGPAAAACLRACAAAAMPAAECDGLSARLTRSPSAQLLRAASARALDVASSIAERSVRLEKDSERLAQMILQWKPLKSWVAVGALLIGLLWLDQQHDSKALLVSLQASLRGSVGACLDRGAAALLENAVRCLLACVATIGTIEVVWVYCFSDNGQHQWYLQGQLERPVRNMKEEPFLAACVLTGLTLCWYLVICPPDAWVVVHTAWRSGCISCAGLFLCASIFEPGGWKYVPLSALCLFFSGSSSCRLLLLLDGLAAAGHSFNYFQRLYFLHEAKRDFHERVRKVLSTDGLHPTFAEESFDKFIMRNLRSPTARRMAFAMHRCLSMGTQARMLQQKRDGAMRSVLAHHKDVDVSQEEIFEIQRDDLLASSLQAVQEVAVGQLLAQTLRITYSGEMGEDEGGLLRDWFDSVGGRLSSEAASHQLGKSERLPLLALHPTDGTLVLRSGTERWDDFYALGRILALAVYRGARVPVHLSRSAWKLLLGVAIDAADIFAIDPQFFTHRVATVLEPGGVEAVGAILDEPLRFVSAATEDCPEPVELVPGGQERLVTEENKLEYVEKLCEFHLCGPVRREWQLLVQGFDDILPRRLLISNGIGDKDLELLIAGLPEIDVNNWRNHCVIDGPLAGTQVGDRLLVWFWDVVTQFGDERRAKLLQFATGSSRLPADGFGGLEPCFCIYLCDGPPERLPTASTCINQLNLSPCPSRRAMIDKLKKVCHEASEGFGLV